jgi:hypothetical protein
MSNQIAFKGQTVYLDEDPKRGVCNRCRYVPWTVHPLTGFIYTTTEMHHIEYDENDPLAYTMELCKLCHKQVKWYDNGLAVPFNRIATFRGYY